jgi:GNAT superfamily N-acetyltransferase
VTTGAAERDDAAGADSRAALEEPSPPGLEIRPVTLDDLDVLVDIYLAGARHHAAIDPDGFRVPDRDDVTVRLRRRVEARGPDSEYVIAVLDGRPAGSATVDVADPPHPGSMSRPIRTAEFGIAILEGFRGLGVGRALIGGMEDWARGHRVERMLLNVSSTNDGAIRLYDRLGYVLAGHEMRRELRGE